MTRCGSAVITLVGALSGGCLTADVEDDNDRTEQLALALDDGDDPELPPDYTIDFGTVTVYDGGPDPIGQLWIDLYYNTWATYTMHYYPTNTTTTSTTNLASPDLPPPESCSRAMTASEADLYAAVVDSCAAKYPDVARKARDAGDYRPRSAEEVARFQRDEVYWNDVERAACPNGNNRLNALGNKFAAKAAGISNETTLVCVAQCVVNSLVGYSDHPHAAGRRANYMLGGGFGNCNGYASLMTSILRAGGVDAQITGTASWQGGSVGHVWVQYLLNGTTYYVEPQNRASRDGLGCGILK